MKEFYYCFHFDLLFDKQDTIRFHLFEFDANKTDKSRLISLIFFVVFIRFLPDSNMYMERMLNHPLPTPPNTTDTRKKRSMTNEIRWLVLLQKTLDRSP